MATSVKIDETVKSRLEELQARIKLETGRKVTQQELLDRLVTDAYDDREEFVRGFRDEYEPPTDEEIEVLLTPTISSGVETDEDDIDEVLYGE